MNKFSKLSVAWRAIKAFVLAGGLTWAAAEYQQYVIDGAVHLDAQDMERLNAIGVNAGPEMWMFIVGGAFAAYRALRNYARNNVMAPDWLKEIFGDNTGVVLLLVCVGLAGFTGCAHDRLRVVERDPDKGVATFELDMSATSTVSKNSVLQNLGYTGSDENSNPWSLNAGQQAQQDTTQMLGLLKELLNVAAQIAPLYAPPAPVVAPIPEE
jgi:hypothetical protein